MASKIWRLKLKGKRSAHEMQTMVGAGGATILRVHVEGDETHVYYAGDEEASRAMAKTFTDVGTAEEVSAEEVTRLG
jgi:hypothetical protein